MIPFGRLILMFGGRGTPGYGMGMQVSVFDTTSKRWMFPTSRSVPPSRWNHSATLIGNTVYLFGGESCASQGRDISATQCLGDMHTLDVNDYQWTDISDKIEPKNTPPARYAHSCSGHNNKLVVFGGATQVHLNDVQVFNTDTYTWTELKTTGQQPTPRCGHSTVIIGDLLWVFGGLSAGFNNDLHCLNMNSHVWRELVLPGSPSPRGHLSFCTVGRNAVIFGGWTDEIPHSHVPNLMNDVHVLVTDEDCLSNTKWITPVVSGSPPSPRNTHAAVIIGGGMYVFGGWDRRNCYNDLTVLEISSFLVNEHIQRSASLLSSKIYHNEEFSDVTLSCRGCEIPGHKVILSASCRYFRDLFRSGMLETGDGQVIAAPVLCDGAQPSEEAFRKFIHFLYGGIPSPGKPEDAARDVEILSLANYYCCDSLHELCTAAIEMNITPSNVVCLLIRAEELQQQTIVNSAIHFVIGNYRAVQPQLTKLPGHLKDAIMKGLVPHMADGCSNGG
eukprot:TRINITY_DN15023_c0_g2_i1.p1 TRINITY_DN15023_c0_g2~~TRINITY_DN15023_c0_g2_i1.p1  ORF type:complete len:530 (+),score=64.92 TRINITY_DN15023_c0_g2_i1:86-1591(+)